MKKYVFNKILKRINEKESSELEITYEEYKDYISLIKNKIKYNKNIYKENDALFDLCELATLTWGFLAISTLGSKHGSKDENLITIFHALTSQISNNNLAILILINSGLEHQTGAIQKTNYELCYTLLTILLNKEKRKKYFDSARLENDVKVWNEEFKLNMLNEEIQKYENSVLKNEKDITKEMIKVRKEVYKHYSSYIHNSFMTCFLNSYYFENDIFTFNIWGEKPIKVKQNLSDLSKHNLVTFLEMFYYIIHNTKIQKYICSDKDAKQFWKSAINSYAIFKEYLFMIIKK